MREIKFRAWSELDKEMFEVASIDLLLGLIVRQCENRIKTYVLEELVLMQYTGLKDRNGVEIYEGDIVKSVALTNDHNQRGATVISPIEYWNENTCLSLTYVPYYPFCLSHDIEVIGNIYENPELLEETH